MSTAHTFDTPRHSAPEMRPATASILHRVLIVAGRTLFAAIFLLSAPAHFGRGTIDYAAAHGVPAAPLLVPFSGVLALLGGLSVLFGARARLGGWLLVAFLVPVTLSLHNFWAVADPAQARVQQTMFMKNMSMLGGALLITQFGAGPFSLDHSLRQPGSAARMRPVTSPESIGRKTNW